MRSLTLIYWARGKQSRDHKTYCFPEGPVNKCFVMLLCYYISVKVNDILFWFDNDPEIESKYHHYNLCLVLFNNSYLEFTRWYYYSEYVFFLYFLKLPAGKGFCSVYISLYIFILDHHDHRDHHDHGIHCECSVYISIFLY